MAGDYFIHCGRIGDTICVKYRDANNAAHFERVQYHPVLYYPTVNKPESVYTTLDGRPVEALPFTTITDADEYKERQRTPAHGDINPINAFLVQRFSELPQVDLSRFLVAWLDIEVDISESLSEPADAKNAILSIVLRVRGHSYAFGVKPYHVTRPDVTYVQCQDESELLGQFLERWTAEYPDIVSGWYIDGYDIPYLVNRIQRVLGKEAKRLLSPWKSVRTVRQFINGKLEEQYEITGVAILDGLALYKKFTPGQRSSYTLDAIAEEVLGDRKVNYYDDYESLARLYTENFQLFMDYNLVDVDLPERIDAKLKYLQMVVSMAHDARVNFADTLKQTRMWDSMIYRYLLERKIVIPPPPAPTLEKKSIVGAYVKESIAGKFKWVVSFDVASLYPSLMRQWSISPDTLIEPEVIAERIVVIRETLDHHAMHPENDWNETPGMWRTTDVTTVPDSVLREWLDALTQLSILYPSADPVCMQDWLLDPNQANRVRAVCQRLHVTITPNKQVFDTTRPGFMGAMLAELIVGRQMWKKKQLALETEALTQSGDQKTETLVAAKVAESMQSVKKIQLNSAYGATGNEHFRYFDARLAEAVTTSGQMLIQSVERQLNQAINTWLNTTAQNEGRGVDYVITSDTDSVYLNLEGLIQKYCPLGTSTSKIVDMVDKFCAAKIQPILNHTFAQAYDVLCGHESIMAMKREVIADAAIFLRKKRYMLNVWDKEGVRYPEPKLKITGLESVRSTVPKVSREGFKKAYALMLRETEDRIWELVSSVQKEFQTAPFDWIAKSSGVSDLNKYAADPMPVGEDLVGNVMMSRPYKGMINPISNRETGCPIHVRGALLYNWYLRETKLSGKYPDIRPGQKIKIAYLRTPNPLGENVIAAPKTLPSEWNLDAYVDRDLQYQKTFLEPLERILDELGWTSEAPPDVVSPLF